MEIHTTKWGTWEELVLGGAVLRHGTRAWDAVAAELRARTLRPYDFTVEACKARYEDLQERYYGCDAWFEELRKQRVAELRRELEKSDGSIGSLESKLENLKTDKADKYQVDYGSSRTVSLVILRNFDGVISSGKEVSKDGLSASSFTEENKTNWFPECRTTAPVLAHETEHKPEEATTDSEREKHAESNSGGCGGRGGSVRRKRGKRKRKECIKEASVGESDVVKEASVGESDMFSSADVAVAAAAIAGCVKDELTGDCDRSVRSANADDYNGSDRIDDLNLTVIFKSVTKNENASVFRCRLDSQKKARYKRMIRRHVDLDSIRSRILDRSIASARELFRDLLLLINNALVFYPKDSREYRSALSLRDFAGETFRRNLLDKGSGDGAAAPIVTEPPARSTPVRPRSVRPSNRNLNAGKVAADSVRVAARTPLREDKKKARDKDPPVVSPAVAKRNVGRPMKVESSRRRPETRSRGRKRARRN